MTLALGVQHLNNSTTSLGHTNIRLEEISSDLVLATSPLLMESHRPFGLIRLGQFNGGMFQKTPCSTIRKTRIQNLMSRLQPPDNPQELMLLGKLRLIVDPPSRHVPSLENVAFGSPFVPFLANNILRINIFTHDILTNDHDKFYFLI
jgi:hypothetical protein